MWCEIAATFEALRKDLFRAKRSLFLGDAVARGADVSKELAQEAKAGASRVECKAILKEHRT